MPRVQVLPKPRLVHPPALQVFPNCLPMRRASVDGSRAAVGVRAETCLADNGDTGAFIVRFIDIQGIPSPAAVAGLKIGDQVRALDSCLVRTAGALTLEIEGVPEGYTTKLLVRRANGSEETVKVLTKLWRPSNVSAAREPGKEGNLCHLAKRQAPSGTLPAGNR